MGLLHNWRLRRAAKAYGQRLGPALARTYGASEHYTQAQIEACARRLGLNLAYICLALASYLPESEYEKLVGDLPVSLGFDEARAVLDRYRPHGFRSATGNSDYDNSSGGGPPAGFSGGGPD